MAELNPPAYMQNRTDHSALIARTLADALTSSSAVVGTNDLKVSQRAAGANMSVDVAGGLAFIEGTESATQGAYAVRSDGTPTNVTIAASSPTLPRIDIIVAKIRDAFYTGVNNDWSIVAVTGTAAASPVAPSAPSNALVLAQVSVAANATSVVNANITDRRVIAAGRLYTGDFTCTSTTRPPVPWTGLTIFETDTKNRYIWDGTSWLLLGKAGAVPFATAAGTVAEVFSGTGHTSAGITFPTGRFSQPPHVYATGQWSTTGIGAQPELVFQITFLSSGGCTLHANTRDNSASSATSNVNWLAVQMTPSSSDG